MCSKGSRCIGESHVSNAKSASGVRGSRKQVGFMVLEDYATNEGFI